MSGPGPAIWSWKSRGTGTTAKQVLGGGSALRFNARGMPSTRQAPSHLLIEVFFLATIISTIKRLLLINGAVIQLPYKGLSSSKCIIFGCAEHPQGSKQRQAGSTLLLVASCCALWQALAARTEARLRCGRDVYR